MESVNFKIAGAAGEGIKVAGLIMAKTVVRSGFWAHGYIEYPSLIRGGHNTFQLNFGPEPVTGPKIKLDLLVALNQESVALHRREIGPQTAVLAEDLPPADRLVKNTVALGASVYLLGVDLQLLKQLLQETFADKGKAVVELNQRAAELGYDYSQKHLKQKRLSLKAPKKEKRILLNGNEAIALGAISAGMKLYAAYPMTPTTSILHYLAEKAQKMNLAVVHAEDEIGVVNMAIGAGFAGVRAMVATSGSGFALMTEGLGLAGISETPLVVVLGMRPGPAGGMPTWSSQGDLLFSLNAAPDESPRLVLAPGDPTEAFNLTRLAFQLAETYQTAVIILTDKNLGESYYTIPALPDSYSNKRYSLLNQPSKSDQPFPRYQLTASGISPRPLPGQPGRVFLANSYEHNQFGYATESANERREQVDKRQAKLKTMAQDALPPRVYGPKTADLTLVSWGSTKGPILEALKQLPRVNLIHFSWLWPFPLKSWQKLAKAYPNLAVVENNSTGQLAQLIKQLTGQTIAKKLLKYDGRIFYPEEIITYVKKAH